MSDPTKIEANLKRGPDSLLAGLLFGSIVVALCLFAFFCSIIYACRRHRKPPPVHAPKPHRDPAKAAAEEAEERRIAELLLSVPGKGGAKAMLKAAAAARDGALAARRAAEADAEAAAKAEAEAAAAEAARAARAKAAAKKGGKGAAQKGKGGKGSANGRTKRGSDDSAEEAPRRGGKAKSGRRIPETELSDDGRPPRRTVLRPPAQSYDSQDDDVEAGGDDYGDDDRLQSVEGSEASERPPDYHVPRGRPPPRRDDDSYGSYR